MEFLASKKFSKINALYHHPVGNIEILSITKKHFYGLGRAWKKYICLRLKE